MTAKGIIVDNKLVINTEIPLLQAQMSEDFRLIAVPLNKGNMTVVAKLKSELIIFNFEFDACYLCNQAQLNRCRKPITTFTFAMEIGPGPQLPTTRAKYLLLNIRTPPITSFNKFKTANFGSNCISPIHGSLR
ncbi:unnamed protein product [Ceratitis capitata]|uniref:(Mediterranean fruit fly) hypothetical protein n=1 Tax=Ceratitis capitata TaxID=7213 RepID=A0A811UTE2_CERCA|nr:unnamed protein product [Ceratitis capitata]